LILEIILEKNIFLVITIALKTGFILILKGIFNDFCKYFPVYNLFDKLLDSEKYIKKFLNN